MEKKNERDPFYAQFAERQKQAFHEADVMMSQAYAQDELKPEEVTALRIGYATCYETYHKKILATEWPNYDYDNEPDVVTNGAEE